MNQTTRALKSILASQGRRYADLATATGLSVSTVEKIATGASTSRRGRRKIEAVLGVEIWPDDHPALRNHRAGIPNLEVQPEGLPVIKIRGNLS